MSDQERDFVKTWHEIVQRAWDDADFKQRVVSEPAAVLAEHGFELPEGQRCEVIEGGAEPNADALSLPLPPKPAPGQLSDDQLAGVVGGVASASSADALQKEIRAMNKQKTSKGVIFRGAPY